MVLPATLTGSIRLTCWLAASRVWLLFEEDIDENFFKAHEGIISFEMIRQSMYEMASTINDESYDIYNNQGELLGVQEDQEEFEVRKIVEWARLHS